MLNLTHNHVANASAGSLDEVWLVDYMQQIDEADDAIWILTSTFTIFTMQSGFGLLESGSVTTKNEVNIMVKNAVDVMIGGLSYMIFGYGFSFGKDSPKYTNAFSGWGNFFLMCDSGDIGRIYPKFFFQASFSTTATTIVSGAMAERTKLEAYIVFSFLNTVIYCFPAHWCWAEDGWLRRLGYVDIAGAGPVHLVGGLTGLVATLILKPRHGRFRSKNPPAMGSPTNAVLGMFMLWWGWLGFNCGSTFGISAFKWKLAARSAISTFVSSVSGGTLAMLISYIVNSRRFDVSYMINGILGSLVSITAYCALAEPWEGLIIGMVAACVVLTGMRLLNKLKIDDPVGVVSVHFMCGCWGLIAAGLFCRDNVDTKSLDFPLQYHGLLTGGGLQLLGVQLIAIVSIATWTLVTSFIVLKLVDVTIGLRVTLKEELIGADVCEHGVGDVAFDKKSQSLIRKRISNPYNNDPFNRRKSSVFTELLSDSGCQSMSVGDAYYETREIQDSYSRQLHENDTLFSPENKDNESRYATSRKRTKYSQKRSAMFGRKRSDGDMYRILWRYGIARVLEDEINVKDETQSQQRSKAAAAGSNRSGIRFAHFDEANPNSADGSLLGFPQTNQNSLLPQGTGGLIRDRTSSNESSDCKPVAYNCLGELNGDMMNTPMRAQRCSTGLLSKDYVRSEPNLLAWQESLDSQYDD